MDVKKTKQEVNYRLPDCCCGKCIHSYQNNYGDCQCKILENGNSISEGCVCNYYQFQEGIEVIPEVKTVVQPPWEKSKESPCLGCFYEKDNWCVLQSKKISKRCDYYDNKEIVEEQVVEEELSLPEAPVFNDDDVIEYVTEEMINTIPGDCSDCAYSIYKDDEPWCRMHDGLLDPDDLRPCEAWTKEGSIVIEEE